MFSVDEFGDVPGMNDNIIVIIIFLGNSFLEELSYSSRW